MKTAVALLALCVLISTSELVYAKRSAECPNGCIIASVLDEERTCACVPDCSNRGAPTVGSLSTSLTSQPSENNRPTVPNVSGGEDCGFCDRDSFTYTSMAECQKAHADFLPKDKGLDKRNYPQLSSSHGKGQGYGVQGSGGPGNSGRRLLQGTCPPTPDAGCQDYSSNTRWESLFSSSTNSTDVVIPQGTTVVIYGCAQTANTIYTKSITVPATSTLIVADSAVTIVTQLLNVSGTFQMGTATCMIKSPITLFMPGGTEGVGIFVQPGATYDVHGFTEGLMWTRVAATVLANTKTITLQEAVSWKAGNTIVLVSTTWKDERSNQNEVLTIASISADGKTITTVENIVYNHYGQEYFAEVGLLTRPILFTSDAASTSTLIGPHQRFLTPNARIQGVALERWGARAPNTLGTYPVHFHLAGETTNAYIKNNAIYKSNWRCLSIHGTNNTYVYNNVGFDITGHCYYLEDGVEERNVLERNLAAYIHPIHTAGSGGGQQGTERFANKTLMDPSDSGASGFYSLNCYNSWINNAASGGFASYTFPQAPRAIKNFKNMKRLNGDGFPFKPSQRPFIAFTGNTGHSTGYFWEHSASVYFGGLLFYKVDPADGVAKLFYQNGRGSVKAEPLCPDPDWPASDSGNANTDCWVNSARDTRTLDFKDEAYLKLDNINVALANVGVMSWGNRIEVSNLKAFDVTRGVEFLGQSWLTNAEITINTTNAINGWAGWPYTSKSVYWESWIIKGVEWYDTFTTSIFTNIVFKNFKYMMYGTNPNDWWNQNTPHAFRMIDWSDQYKPDKTMMATKNIKCENCDFGDANGKGGAFFQFDWVWTGAAKTFNWFDSDGSVIRHVRPDKPAGPYLITSWPDWWKLDNVNSWLETKFKGLGPGSNGLWVNPMTGNDEHLARIEMRVQSASGSRMTCAWTDCANNVKIGYVSNFGADSYKKLDVTYTEGTLGMTGKTGWYSVWNMSTTNFHAPKRLELVMTNVPRTKKIYWSSCWPAGTTLSVSRTFDWATCSNQEPLIQTTTRDRLLQSAGLHYFVENFPDAVCLHLKLVDPGHPWQFDKNFVRDSLMIQEEIHWNDFRYTIVASGTPMQCADTYMCPFPAGYDPATRVPAAITTQPAECTDVAPSGTLCPSVKCAWTYWPGCSATTIVNGGYCRGMCNTCQFVDSNVVPSPSPPPAASPSPPPPPRSPPPPRPSPPPPRPPPPPFVCRASGLGCTSGCTCSTTCCSKLCSGSGSNRKCK